MLWGTQPKPQLRSLNLSSTLHKEWVLGPKRLLYIEEIENTLSQVWPHFSIALCRWESCCSCSQWLLLDGVQETLSATGAGARASSAASSAECIRLLWEAGAGRDGCCRVQTFCDGAVFWVAMVRATTTLCSVVTASETQWPESIPVQIYEDAEALTPKHIFLPPLL